ncbi:unnamed protein product [Effrenium voratum]|nr:unnamed protein product [Effrenium voratum]
MRTPPASSKRPATGCCRTRRGSTAPPRRPSSRCGSTCGPALLRWAPCSRRTSPARSAPRLLASRLASLATSCARTMPTTRRWRLL